MFQQFSLYNIIILGVVLPFVTDICYEIKRFVYSRIYKKVTVKQNTMTYTHMQWFIRHYAMNVNEMVADGSVTVSSSNIDMKGYVMTLAFGKYQLRHEDNLFTAVYSSEIIEISCYSWRGFEPLHQMLESAREQYKKQFDNEINTYIPFAGYAASWKCHKSIRKRNWSTVIVSTSTKSTICEDLQRWEMQKDVYLKLGVPHKRCYLFHGSPGCGKTSSITTIASQLDKNIYNLDISSEHCWSLLSEVPKNSIIVIEDIDRYFVEVRDEKDNKKIIDWSPNFSLPKLMSALDGNGINDECLIIMTCNDMHKFPEVMIRPGRVDLQIEFLNTDADGCRRYIELVYGSKISKKTKDDMVSVWTKQKSLTYAQMQQHLFKYINDPDLAFKMMCNYNPL